MNFWKYVVQFIIHLVGIPGRGTGPSKGLCVHRKNVHKYPCSEWDSNLWFQCSSGYRHNYNYHIKNKNKVRENEEGKKWSATISNHLRN
jgi:hypothetical protein